MGTDPALAIAIAVIAAVAALIGAVIAAKTAGTRQDKQLNQDADRQRLELEHDRELSELSELRAVLDEAAHHITSAERAMLDATDAWISEGVLSDRLRTRMREAMDAMWGSAQRIRIRIGSDEVHEAYWAATHAHQELLGVVWLDASDQDQGARSDAVFSLRGSFLNQRDTFFEEAHRKYGSRGLRRE